MSDIKSEVHRLALSGVDMLQDRAGGGLDFTAKSLSAVEEILSEASEFFSELPQEQVTAIVQRVGCYILEVAHRQFGGEFFWHNELDQPVLVVGEPEKHIALVTWDKVHGRLSGDPGDNIPFFYDGFSEQVASSSAGTRALYA